MGLLSVPALPGHLLGGATVESDIRPQEGAQQSGLCLCRGKDHNIRHDDVDSERHAGRTLLPGLSQRVVLSRHLNVGDNLRHDDRVSHRAVRVHPRLL